MNGYCQLEVFGKVRGLKFGALAAENIMVKLAKLTQETGGNYTSAMMTEIVYWGLYNNSYAKREDPDYTFEQVVDFVDENWMSDVMSDKFTEIAKCFEESKSCKLLTGKVNEALEKKKAMTLSGTE